MAEQQKPFWKKTKFIYAAGTVGLMLAENYIPNINPDIIIYTLIAGAIAITGHSATDIVAIFKEKKK